MNRAVQHLTVFASETPAPEPVLGEVVTLAMEGDSAPEWLHLLPVGDLTKHFSNGKRRYRLESLEDARRVIEASMAGGRDLLLDFDHQTEYAARPGVGGQAPAAGWITELDIRDDGIWGRVNWTPRGAEAVAAREYRFVSPVFKLNQAGRVQLLMRASLVNSPAFTELKAVASLHEGAPMDKLKEIAKALGLDEDADAEAVIAAIGSLKTAAGVATIVAKAFGLDEDAEPEAIAAAAAQAKDGGDVDPARYVPRTEFDALTDRVKQLQEDASTTGATAAVEAAIASGKLAPASKDWGLAYAAKDPDGFAQFVDKAPAILKPGTSMAATPKPEAGEDGLTDDQRAVAASLGVSAEDYAKTLGVKKDD